MAGFNNNNRNGNNYIQSMYDRFGDNWIVSTRPEDIQRSSKRILKDIVMGRVDYAAYGATFLDLKFLENLIIGISNQLEINTLNYTACKFYFQYYPQTKNLGAHIFHLERLNNIYTTVIGRLNAVKMDGNIGWLTDISSVLYNDRNHLND